MRLHASPIANYFFVIVAMLALNVQSATAERYYPVDYGRITSVRGWHADPFGSGKLRFHHGWDIACPHGTPVYPTQRGFVLFTGDYKGYGKMVEINHQNGYVTLYAHNSKLLVDAGQAVDTTNCTALSGSTGRSTGAHVHYEIRVWPRAVKNRGNLEND